MTRRLAYKNTPAVSVNSSIQTGLFRKPVRLGRGRGEKCPRFLFAYISTISSAKSVIQGCIEKEFHTLSIEILKCCNKILFRIKKASFRKVVNFRKLVEKERSVSKVNDFGDLLDRMIKSKIFSQLESP